MNAFTDVTGSTRTCSGNIPSSGLIPAEEFMPLAEDTGMAIPIGRFALEHALAQLARWRDVQA